LGQIWTNPTVGSKIVFKNVAWLDSSIFDPNLDWNSPVFFRVSKSRILKCDVKCICWRST